MTTIAERSSPAEVHATVERRSPAEVYDEVFVPALFQQWGPVVAAAAKVGPGDRVLDVACGTGALTLAVAELVGAGGAVVGLDANPEMLAVARCKPAPSSGWRARRRRCRCQIAASMRSSASSA